MIVLIPRNVNRFIARLLVGVMVFAQMMVAAYACAGAQGASMRRAGGFGTDVAMSGTAMADLADGDLGHAAMDPAQPNLCAAHCQSSQQNADGKPSPSVSAAIPTSLYPRELTVLHAGIQRASTAADGLLPKADPPHAILHCCFRI
ncbi:MAG: hypothetical protein ABIO45_03955 [Burkholderiaceae bacterium]